MKNCFFYLLVMNFIITLTLLGQEVPKSETSKEPYFWLEKKSKTEDFPLSLGNKWYYKNQATYEHRYAAVKEITAILDSNTREVTCTYYHMNRKESIKEQWKYINGEFYISLPYENLLIYIDTLTTNYYNPGIFSTSGILYKDTVFNIPGTAQRFTNFGKGTSKSFTTFPGIGIISWYLAYGGGGLHDNRDSAYLSGIFINGEVLGDTVIHAPEILTASFPLNLGQEWIYSLQVNPDNGKKNRLRKKVTKTLDSGVREITATYDFVDSIDIQKEYWAFQNGRFYISREPNLTSKDPYLTDSVYYYSVYDLSSECVRPVPTIVRCQGIANDYTFKSKTYDAQYLTLGDAPLRSHFRLIVANELGPVKYFDQWQIYGPYSYELLDMNVTSVQEIELPQEYKLYQNYPNPFNPNTTIVYEMPSADYVKIKIYDILGNEITSLVNEEKSAGKYSVEFNGSTLASGVYYYKLETGKFIEVKKLMLIK